MNQTYQQATSGTARVSQYNKYRFDVAGNSVGANNTFTIGGAKLRELALVVPGHHRAYLTVFGEGGS